MERRVILRRNRNGTYTLLCDPSVFIAYHLFDVVSPSLGSILQKRILASEKLDEIKIKANILAAFAAEKVAEVKDTIERAIEDL